MLSRDRGSDSVPCATFSLYTQEHKTKLSYSRGSLHVRQDFQYFRDVSTESTLKLSSNYVSLLLQATGSFLGLFELVLTFIQLNQFIMFGVANSRFVYLTYDVASVRSIPNNKFDGSCSCGKSSDCSRSQGFFCLTSDCFDSATKPNQTIPGFVSSCSPVDSLLASSLQCLYDTACIQMLLDWRPFDFPAMTTYTSLPSLVPLDPMMDSHFSPNTTLYPIVSRLFIDDWANSTDFHAYFNECAPNECTYSYDDRFNRAYIVATVFAVVGGLSSALRILAPIAVKLCRRMHRHCCRTQAQVARGPPEETGKNDNHIYNRSGVN